MVPLAKDSDESHLIEQYARSGGCANKIEAIFYISREGESERCQKWSLERHKMLLWHGSAISNFLGILRNGLKIAPPEAPPTGYMFGKGVYFADTFSKSFQYTGGFSDRAFMLLSEVVLGKMYLRYQSEYVEKLPEGYLSTKGCGQNGPDMGKCIVLNSGAVVPLGPIVQYPPPDTPEKTYYLHQNEYIVYDISQVRLRYLVEVKTQAEDQLG
jgi:poly [ADP-ribose] polymerase